MERLGVGRTPVNQALHRLSAEGLIRIIPRKGAMASPLSINDALELIEVRLVNEMLCMRLAAAAITEAELAELQTIAEQFEAAAAAARRGVGDESRPALSREDRPGGAQRHAAGHPERAACTLAALLGHLAGD